MNDISEEIFELHITGFDSELGEFSAIDEVSNLEIMVDPFINKKMSLQEKNFKGSLVVKGFKKNFMNKPCIIVTSILSRQTSAA